MKIIITILLWTMSAFAQTKPCIAFHTGASDSVTAKKSRDALETAVTLSGDYDFSPTLRNGCWTVDELSFSVPGVLGYAISYVVTNPSEQMVYHGLATGQEDEFELAMRKAAAEAIKDIRRSRAH